MTIALGILATDAVVLAADTEETFGETKFNQSKVQGAINFTKEGHRYALIAGAGNSTYIDAYAQSLGLALRDARLAKSEPMQVFNEALERFYVRKVAPFAAYGPHERPDFGVIIGYSGDHRVRLYSSQYAALAQETRYAAIGLGAGVARPILARFLDHDLPVSLVEAVLIASYAVFRAKESVQTVGKDTQIVAVTAGGGWVMPPTYVFRELDATMRLYSDGIEPLVFGAPSLARGHSTRQRWRLSESVDQWRG